MPYVIATMLYPGKKAHEVAQKYTEVNKKVLSDENLLKLIIPAAVKSTEQGIKTLAIVEVQNGNLREVYTRTAKMMSNFRSIEGFEYTTDIYFTLPEAFAALGMNLPE